MGQRSAAGVGDLHCECDIGTGRAEGRRGSLGDCDLRLIRQDGCAGDGADRIAVFGISGGIDGVDQIAELLAVDMGGEVEAQ